MQTGGGIKPLTFNLVENLLDLLSHSHHKWYHINETELNDSVDDYI